MCYVVRCRLQSALDLCRCTQLCPTTLCRPMDCSFQVLLSMDSGQEYWSELTFLTPEDLPDPGIKPTSLVSPTLAGPLHRVSLLWACGLLTIPEESKPTPQIRGSPPLAVPLSFGSKNKT